LLKKGARTAIAALGNVMRMIGNDDTAKRDKVN
jgi:hypothetical protein